MSVTDLFKKYDLDEISDILVKIKKEIFVRTNQVKKVIGSNPDLMIDFGENVLNIYNASTKLNESTLELLRDIEDFTGSLEEMVSGFVQQELPELILKEDLSSVLGHQGQCEKLYFGILESFSKKSFIQSYELYLEYKQLLSGDSPEAQNSIFGDSSFIKQSLSSSCFTFIQSCEKLTSIELAQLIMIRYLLEIEDKDTDHFESVSSEFKTILETTLILRVDETTQSLKNSRVEGGNVLGTLEECNSRLGRTFITSMGVLVDLYELRESMLLVFSEFRQRGWHRFESTDGISAHLSSISDSDHILRLKSALLEEFGSLAQLRGAEPDSPEPDEESGQVCRGFRFKFLSRIYSDLFDTIQRGVGTDILKGSFFPILVSAIKEDLAGFLMEGGKDQLLELILRPEEDAEPCSSRKANSVFEDNEAVKWLISKNDRFETLLREIISTGELLDRVEPSGKSYILESIFEACFSSVLTKFVEFNRALFWSIRGRGCKQTPDIVLDRDGDSLAKIHRFSNILIRGKQLEFLESCLIELLSTDQSDSRLSYQSLSQDSRFGHGSVNWKTLMRISNEVTASLENSSRDTNAASSSVLCFLEELARSFVSPSCLSAYLQKMRTLNTIIYSLVIHREDLCQKVCTYQSLLQKTSDSLTAGQVSKDDILTLTSLSRQFGFSGDSHTVTPHILLLELCLELNMISTHLTCAAQRSSFDQVCKSYIDSYIVPFQVKVVKAVSDLYSVLLDETPEYRPKHHKELIVSSLAALYCDLVWCTSFSVCENSSDFSRLDSPNNLSSTLEAVTGILTPENLDSIRDGVLSLLKELKQDYNMEVSGQPPQTQTLFANNVQRFHTQSLVKSSKGSISNKIAVANDKTLKANIDSNSITGRSDCDQFLLSYYSNILKNYNTSDSISLMPKVSSVVNSQEALSNFSSSNLKDGGSSSNNPPGEHSSVSLKNNSGPGGIGINAKIDTNAIWQVSNLLKETVKDKVFGQ